jgi:hypothetical protein
MPISRIPGVGLETTGTASVNTFLRGDNAWAGTITSGTAVASTSGTSIDFTGIPATAKRITVMFSGVSLSGTDNFLIQIGPSGGVETSSYSSSSIYGGSATGSGVSTAGFLLINGAASNVISGIITLVNLNGNTWVYNGMASSNGDTVIVYGTGVKTTASTLAIVRVTRSGTNTFDAGTINIMWES